MKIKNQFGLILLMVLLLGTMVNALPVSVETSLNIQTYQPGNNSGWVRIETVEDTYEFDCSLTRTYDYDIDFIKEVDCSDESDIVNLTKSLVSFSSSNMRSNSEFNTLLNTTVNGCLDRNDKLNTENKKCNVQLIACRTDLNYRPSTKNYDELVLNLTRTHNLLDEETESKSFGNIIAFVLGAFGMYFLQRKKYPKGVDPGMNPQM